MKKHITKGFAIFTCVVAIIACKDTYLDTPPQAALSGSTLSSSKPGVDATVISAYKSLIGWTQNWNEQAWGTAPSNWTFNSATDEVHKGSEAGDLDEGLQLELFQWNPGNPILRSKWIATYEGVVRSNSAIKTATEYLKLNPEQTNYANGRIGEAIFLRSYYNFEAYKVWKNVPYYSENDVDFKKANDKPILPLIIEDLKKAITLLPAKRDQVGRTDKMVATAYLGKALLYNQDFAGAKVQFDLVVASGRFKLVDCFYDNFSVAGDNNDESIFAAQTSVNDGAGDGDNSNFAERLALPHGSSPFGCCGFKTPSYEQAYAYRVDANGLPISVEGQTLKRLSSGASDVLDPRIDFTMGRTDVPYLDWGVQKDDWVRGQGYAGWYSPKKNAHASKDPSLSGSWAGNQLSPLNIELMRYSDLLLMLAECEVEVGSLSKAQELVNMIRVRAGKCAQGKSAITVPMNAAEITWAKYNVKPYVAVWTDKAVARDAVRLERRLELALEGHRIFDLQRWGIYQTTMPKYHAREKMLINVFSGVGVVEAKHNMFPLPNTEIQRSEGALKQNQGF